MAFYVTCYVHTSTLAHYVKVNRKTLAKISGRRWVQESWWMVQSLVKDWIKHVWHQYLGVLLNLKSMLLLASDWIYITILKRVLQKCNTEIATAPGVVISGHTYQTSANIECLKELWRKCVIWMAAGYTWVYALRKKSSTYLIYIKYQLTFRQLQSLRKSFREYDVNNRFDKTERNAAWDSVNNNVCCWWKNRCNGVKC